MTIVTVMKLTTDQTIPVGHLEAAVGAAATEDRLFGVVRGQVLAADARHRRAEGNLAEDVHPVVVQAESGSQLFRGFIC